MGERDKIRVFFGALWGSTLAVVLIGMAMVIGERSAGRREIGRETPPCRCRAGEPDTGAIVPTRPVRLGPAVPIRPRG